MVTSQRLRRSGAWMTPARLAKCAGGRVQRSGAPAEDVCTDSRKVGEGTCFIAMVGAERDGHEYLSEAFARGAVGAIVSQKVDRDLVPEGRFIVRVPDTGAALLALAAEHRRRHDATVIGITGSCGKTSTKDILAHVLSAGMATVRSPQSYNNHVGVPLSLTQIRPETQAAVIEIGTNAPGEVAALTAVAAPDIGIVTCVSEAHLAGLGSLEGVAREKRSLVEGLRPGGVAILNGDDRACRAMAERVDGRTVMISASGEADWFATDIQFHGLGTVFKLQGERAVTLPRVGTHNVYNALFAIAAATELGMSLDAVLEALATIAPTNRRLECRECGDVTVVDDTYNMNPTSSRAALSALSGLVPNGRKIVVFGEMLELGEQSEALHRALGAEVAESGIDLLVTVGERAAVIAEGAEASGLPALAITRAEDLGDALERLVETVDSGDLVLVKASRSVGLDRLVDRLARKLGESYEAEPGPQTDKPAPAPAETQRLPAGRVGSVVTPPRVGGAVVGQTQASAGS